MLLVNIEIATQQIHTVTGAVNLQNGLKKKKKGNYTFYVGIVHLQSVGREHYRTLVLQTKPCKFSLLQFA